MSVPLVPGPPGAPNPATNMSMPPGMPSALTAGPGANTVTGISPFGPTDFNYRQGSQPGMFWANETIPHHYVTVSDLGNPSSAKHTAQQLGIGMLLFARDTAYVAPSGNKTFSSTSQAQTSATTTQFLEWSQLTRWLQDPTCCAGNRYRSADDLLSEWHLTGVLKVEVAPNQGHSKYGDRAPSRIVNLIVGGRVQTFNLWGGRLVETLPLYFIVKKEAAGNTHTNGTKRLPNGESKNPTAEDVKSYVWKVIPYADRKHPRPQTKDLLYWDLDDTGKRAQLCVGARLYVGTLTQKEDSNNMPTVQGSHSADAVAEQMRHFSLGTVEISCGV